MTTRQPQLAGTYKWVRLGIVPVVWIWTMVLAFREGYLPGFLCLLLPPYLLYYAFSRVESYPLRGTFFAVVLALGAEVYFMPDNAWALMAQDWTRRLADGGQGLIKDAGESPVYKY